MGRQYTDEQGDPLSLSWTRKKQGAENGGGRNYGSFFKIDRFRVQRNDTDRIILLVHLEKGPRFPFIPRTKVARKVRNG